MRSVMISILALFLCLAFSAIGKADLRAGISIGDDGIEGFYLAVGDHYKVPEKEVVVVRERNIPDEELPVVFFLAARAQVAPNVIIELRLGGKSWMDITTHYGLTAETYYVPVDYDPGPPYGNAYGHFKNRKRAEWGSIRLTDVEIVDMVNLRFISEHYGCPPEEVIKMREKGGKFVDINRDVKKNKSAKQQKKSSVADKSDSGKGKHGGKPK